MISAQITIKAVDDVIPIIDWCEKNIGTKAPFKDCVDTERPWVWDAAYGTMTYYFANEGDASWFALRWL